MNIGWSYCVYFSKKGTQKIFIFLKRSTFLGTEIEFNTKSILPSWVCLIQNEYELDRLLSIVYGIGSTNQKI